MRAITLLTALIFTLVGCSEMLPESAGNASARVNIGVKQPTEVGQKNRVESAFIDNRTKTLDILLFEFPFGSYDDIVKLRRCIEHAWTMSGSEMYHGGGDIITPDIRSECNVPGVIGDDGIFSLDLSPVKQATIVLSDSAASNATINNLEPGTYMVAVVQADADDQIMSKVRSYVTLEPGNNNVTINLLYGHWHFDNPIELQLLHKYDFFQDEADEADRITLGDSPASTWGLDPGSHLTGIYLHQTEDIHDEIYFDDHTYHSHPWHLFEQYHIADMRFQGLLDRHPMYLLFEGGEIQANAPAFIMQQFTNGANSHKIAPGELFTWSGSEPYHHFGLVFYGADGTPYLNTLASTPLGITDSAEIGGTYLDHYWVVEDLSEPGHPVIELNMTAMSHNVIPFDGTHAVLQELAGLDSGEVLSGTLVEFFSTDFNGEGGIVDPIMVPDIVFDPEQGFTTASTRPQQPTAFSKAHLNQILQQQLMLQRAENELGVGRVHTASAKSAPKCFTSYTHARHAWLLYRYDGTKWVPGTEVGGEFEPLPVGSPVDAEGSEVGTRTEVCLHPYVLTAQQSGSIGSPGDYPIEVDCSAGDCDWIPSGTFAFPDDGGFSLNDPYVRLVPEDFQCEPGDNSPTCYDNIVCSIDPLTGNFGGEYGTCYVFSNDLAATEDAVANSTDFQLILFDNDGREVPNHHYEDTVYLMMYDFIPGETLGGVIVVEFNGNRHDISVAESFLFNFYHEYPSSKTTYLSLQNTPIFRYTETWDPSEVLFKYIGSDLLPLSSGTLDTVASLTGNPYQDIHKTHWVYFGSGPLVFSNPPDTYDVNIHWFSDIPMFAPLNDTGISTCVTYDGTSFGTSDCTVGPAIPLQDAYYGTYSFAFEKIDESGDVLPEAEPDWDCVRDNASGLLWQADGNQNGFWGDFPLPEPGFCGCEKWRVPAREELRSLIDYQKLLDDEAPAISDDFFPDSIMSFYWSSTGSETHAWAVCFGTGMEEFKERIGTETWGYRAVCAPY
ncbi:DUF1566 domain-containing protein [Desulfurispira natronophila]|uniref:Lcl C-terminal domain-containing protein n=1 Tax=Desulfurispira natronophila TaxID=682562 RepID=A0A7W8DHR6_9BACT|nr:DUF1566 domain-containing protein [Desulfurispira natronophila]MBB5022578.1 hypothetical protein [Desulfurispira natronophila]